MEQFPLPTYLTTPAVTAFSFLFLQNIKGVFITYLNMIKHIYATKRKFGELNPHYTPNSDRQSVFRV